MLFVIPDRFISHQRELGRPSLERKWVLPQDRLTRIEFAIGELLWVTKAFQSEDIVQDRIMVVRTPQSRPVVLVVEDEPLILMETLDLVSEAGFEAIGAANADEAIRILESRDDVRLVFTDVHMPGSINGIQLAHAVRDRWPPIYLIVTSGLFLLSEQNLPAGTRFFPKPYQHVQIKDALKGFFVE
jgi:CheY-like chemotaxis protein